MSSASPGHPQSQPQRPRILRIAGCSAALLVVAGWVCLGLGLKWKSHDLVTWYFGAHFGAFIIGMMSFDKVGGLSAVVAALTMVGWFVWFGAHPVGG